MNCAERVNEELKKRTRLARPFANDESLFRLVSEVLSEISEELGDGKELPQHERRVARCRENSQKRSC